MEENRFRAALWDMDGTLFYTKPGIERALKEALKVLGLKELPTEDVDSFIGPPIQDSLERYFGLSRQDAIDGAQVFRSFYQGRDYVLECSLYDGIPEVLSSLRERGVHIAVATLKKQDMAERICEKYDISGKIDCIYGTDPNDDLKKHDIIGLCCRHFGIEDHKQAVMIGDSRYDAIGAEKAGASFLAVTYGFGFHAPADVELYPHIGIAGTAEEVLSYF